MKHQTNYGNWVPLQAMKVLVGACVLLALLSALILTKTSWFLVGVGLSILCIFAVLMTIYMGICRYLFTKPYGMEHLFAKDRYIRLQGFDGLMAEIHHFLVAHLDFDGNGTLIDIGCGSGALTVRTAKTFPNAKLVGVDFWGKEWSYAKEQCENNAHVEGVCNRITFQKGDAAELDFPDEFFDAAVSNFVFHEVRSVKDKSLLIDEALRVVKKGGAFAFQDLFCQKSIYGDMDVIIQRLKDSGVSEVHFIPHVEKLGFVPPFVQAPWMVDGIGLLYGRK